MKGDPRVLDLLNEMLTIELTAIIQYVLQARACDKSGLKRLYKRFRAASADEMKNADVLKERILYLKGVPNLQRLAKVSVGKNVPQMQRLDLELERTAIGILNQGINLARQTGDNGTAGVLQDVLGDEQEHAKWLEREITATDQMGVKNYLAEENKQSMNASGPSDAPSRWPVVVLGHSRQLWDGVVYEPDQRLFLPSSRPPPVGDELALQIWRSDGSRFESQARVAAACTPGERSPGAPAGFTLELLSPSPAFIRTLGSSSCRATVRGGCPLAFASTPRPSLPRSRAPRGPSRTSNTHPSNTWRQTTCRISRRAEPTCAPQNNSR